MAIENVNSVQPIKTNLVEDVKREEEVKTASQQKGSSKDVIAVLASLAAIGAAGIAIYKHKNAKKAVEKAEQEAKKKIDAAEEKAKKAAEEVDKKIQEAVDKAKEELKGTKTPKTPETEPAAGSKPSGKGSKRSGRGVGGGSSRKRTKGFSFTFDSKIGGKKSDPLPIDPPIVTGGPAPKPPVPPKPPVTPKPTVTSTGEPSVEPIVTEGKPSVWERFKSIFKRKEKAEVPTAEPKPKTPTAEPKPSVPTAEPKPATPTPEPKPEPAVVTPEPKPSVPTSEAALTEDKPSAWERFKGIFKRKEKAETPAPGIMEEEIQPVRIFMQDEKRVPKVLEGGTLDTSLTVKDGHFVQNLREGGNGIIFVPKEPPKFIQKIQNLFKRKAKPVETQEAEKIIDKNVPEVEELPEIIELPDIRLTDEGMNISDDLLKFKGRVMSHEEYMNDVTQLTEEQLISDYNALKEAAMKLPAADPTAKRFLEIKGELFNHRGYSFKNGVPVKRSELYAKPKPISEIFKGIKLPDVTTISEQNLITEYNALKGIAEKLPVADPTAQRFLEIKGELFNHRGYRFKNGVPVKFEKKIEKTPEIAQLVEQTRADLKGTNQKVVIDVPKKHTNYEHKQIQKQYDEMAKELAELDRKAEQKAGAEAVAKEKEANIKEVKPVEVKADKVEPQTPAVPKAEPKIEPKATKIEPAVSQVKGLVDRSTAEFQGLSEENALQLEYANCKYCVEKLYQFFSTKQEPYKARMAEIESELAKLGKKVNPDLFTEGTEGGLRLKVANQRACVTDSIKSFKEDKFKFERATDELHEAGIDAVPKMPAEMDLQGSYLFNKRMADNFDFYADDLKRATKRLEENGYKPFEVVTENDKVIADYMEKYHFKTISESNLYDAQLELNNLETKLAKALA